MSDPLDPSCPAPETTNQRRRRYWIEFGVVACVAVVYDFVNTFSPYEPPGDRWRAFDALMLVVRSAVVLAPILYIMWRSGEGWSRFGFRSWRWRIDLPLTAVLMMLAWLSFGLYALITTWSLPALRPPTSWGDAQVVLDRLAMIPADAANGIAEEVAIWGFLSTRLRDLSGSPRVAVVVCAAMFASYHLYQGVWSAGAVFVFGLVHGIVFMHLRRIWPLAAAHAFGNILRNFI